MNSFFFLLVIQLFATSPPVLAQLRRATTHISKLKELEEDRRALTTLVTPVTLVPTPPVPTVGTTPQPVRPSQKPVRPTPQPVRTTSKPVAPVLPSGRPVVATPKPTIKGNFLTLPPATGGIGSQSGKTCQNSSFYQSLTGASTIIPCKQNSDCVNWKQDGDGCCLHPYCICGAISATVGSSAVTCLTF